MNMILLVMTRQPTADSHRTPEGDTQVLLCKRGATFAVRHILASGHTSGSLIADQECRESIPPPLNSCSGSSAPADSIIYDGPPRAGGLLNSARKRSRESPVHIPEGRPAGLTSNDEILLDVRPAVSWSCSWLSPPEILDVHPAPLILFELRDTAGDDLARVRDDT